MAKSQTKATSAKAMKKYLSDTRRRKGRSRRGRKVRTSTLAEKADKQWLAQCVRKMKECPVVKEDGTQDIRQFGIWYFAPKGCSHEVYVKGNKVRGSAAWWDEIGNKRDVDFIWILKKD